MKPLLYVFLLIFFGDIKTQAKDDYFVSIEKINNIYYFKHINFSEKINIIAQTSNSKFALKKTVLITNSLIRSFTRNIRIKVAINNLKLNTPLTIQLVENNFDIPVIDTILKHKKQKYKDDYKGIDIKLINSSFTYQSIQKHVLKFAIDFSIDTAEIVKEIGVYTGEWKDTSQVFYLLITKKISEQDLPDTSNIILKKAIKIKHTKGWSIYEINNFKLNKGDYFLIADFSTLNFSGVTDKDYSIRMGTAKLNENLSGYLYSFTMTDRLSAEKNKWEYKWRNLNTNMVYIVNKPGHFSKDKPFYSYPALKIRLLKPVL